MKSAFQTLLKTLGLFFCFIFLMGAVIAVTFNPQFGSWTPSAIGSTSAGAAGTSPVAAGLYGRLGRLVYVTGKVSWGSHTGTGNLRISSLPFNPSTSNVAPPCSFYADGLTLTASSYLAGAVDNSVNQIVLYSNIVGGGTPVQVAMDTAVPNLLFTCIYMTD